MHWPVRAPFETTVQSQFIRYSPTFDGWTNYWRTTFPNHCFCWVTEKYLLPHISLVFTPQAVNLNIIITLSMIFFFWLLFLSHLLGAKTGVWGAGGVTDLQFHYYSWAVAVCLNEHQALSEFLAFVIINFTLLNRSLGILKGVSAECSCLLRDFAQTYSLTFFCILHTARESRWKADLWISLIVCRAGGCYICLIHYWLGFCSSRPKLRTWFKSKR